MSTHDATHDHGNTLDASLRLQLRGLRRDLPPDDDLWPGIAARIEATARGTATPAAPRKAPNIAPWALAASLVMSLGIAWRMQPPPAPAAAPVQLVDREADSMTREYRAALQELQAAAPAPTASRRDPATPALRELDRSARQIRAAIERDPGATYLLGRLQRTYARRLELTQRSLG
ncbi:MAG: hypothetical protein EPO30_00495 [Lysobacteraceae bacterium]|nr:MAG: hypothetical protein EPO30_00495 [Xanthomonadaceae bacterium]